MLSSTKSKFIGLIVIFNFSIFLNACSGSSENSSKSSAAGIIAEAKKFSPGVLFQKNEPECGSNDYTGWLIMRPLANGQYIIATSCYHRINKSFFAFLSRINSDGSLDLGYGVNGKLTLQPTSTNPDCRFFAPATNTPNFLNYTCGSGQSLNGDYFILKLGQSGLPDQRFGSNGLLKYDVSAYDGNKGLAKQIYKEGNILYVTFDRLSGLGGYNPLVRTFSADSGSPLSSQDISHHYPAGIETTENSTGVASRSSLAFWQDGTLRQGINTFNFAHSYEKVLEKPVISPLLTFAEFNQSFMFSNFVLYVDLGNVTSPKAINFLKLVKQADRMEFDGSFGNKTRMVRSLVKGINFDFFMPTVPDIGSSAIIETQVKYKSTVYQSLPVASTSVCGWPYQIKDHLIFFCDTRDSGAAFQAYFVAFDSDGEIDASFFPRGRIDVPSNLLSQCKIDSMTFSPRIREAWDNFLSISCRSMFGTSDIYFKVSY